VDVTLDKDFVRLLTRVIHDFLLWVDEDEGEKCGDLLQSKELPFFRCGCMGNGDFDPALDVGGCSPMGYVKVAFV
jgi:hypothetical protein